MLYLQTWQVTFVTFSIVMYLVWEMHIFLYDALYCLYDALWDVWCAQGLLLHGCYAVLGCVRTILGEYSCMHVYRYATKPKVH